MNMLANLRISDANDSAERRQGSRLAVDSGSTLRIDKRGAVDIVVSDLSETGCAIRVPFTLMIGTQVSIGLVGFGTYEATVVRKDGDVLGCEFVQPIAAHIVANAFATTTVVFPDRLAAPPAADIGFPQPAVDRWPLGRRVGFIVASSSLLWALIALAVLEHPALL